MHNLIMHRAYINPVAGRRCSSVRIPIVVSPQQVRLHTLVLLSWLVHPVLSFRRSFAATYFYTLLTVLLQVISSTMQLQLPYLTVLLQFLNFSSHPPSRNNLKSTSKAIFKFLYERRISNEWRMKDFEVFFSIIHMGWGCSPVVSLMGRDCSPDANHFREYIWGKDSQLYVAHGLR